jgi:SAM-dependent methyltransferase
MSLATLLESNPYLRERLQPTPGDEFYLHLSDLLIAIRSMSAVKYSKVLDYGSGGSPYRRLFEPTVYHRADLEGGPNLDFTYGPSAVLPADLSDYDCVLSTQVLEHVQDPAAYLQECHRVLRPGGHLILTTHGLFEDHGCPYDYWRWTVYGLKRLVESSGLQVNAVKKLTTGPRCAVFLAERDLSRLRFDSAGLYGKLLSLGTRLVRKIGSGRWHRACDICFAENRVVETDMPQHDRYVAIALQASRVN